jgi:V-type H+-transporting ATPase subunit H
MHPFHTTSSTELTNLHHATISHRALSLPDEFVQVKAVQLLAVLISSCKTPIPTTILKPALSLISTQLTNSDPKYRDVALLSLTSLLASSSARRLLWSLSLPTSTSSSAETSPRELSLLPTLLKILQQNTGGGPSGTGTPDTQLQYSVVFCFWELTFEKDVAEGIDKRFSLIPLLSNLALSSPKEKVLRLTLAIFKNLLFLPPSSPNSTVVLPASISPPSTALPPPPPSTLSALLPLLPHLSSLSSRKWNDEDLPADLSDLISTLKAGSANRSSWEAWSEEVRSGRLVPGEAHESEGFWLENKGKFENGMEGGELMKVLVDLLKNSGDAEVLAVACSDVGLYVQANGDRAKK